MVKVQKYSCILKNIHWIMLAAIRSLVTTYFNNFWKLNKQFWERVSMTAPSWSAGSRLQYHSPLPGQ